MSAPPHAVSVLAEIGDAEALADIFRPAAERFAEVPFLGVRRENSPCTRSSPSGGSPSE